VQSFNVLQQRLNRKAVTPKLVAEFPAHLRVYDILAEGEEDLRALPFAERRRRLEALVARLNDPRIDLSPMVPFESWEDLAAARANPASVGAGPDADAIEGVMVKRADSPYLPGRPKGYWYKWKREPYLVDAVMMYGQRGHGKRSSFYSDYTFGVWREGPNGDELVPVGKAYHGFTDEELVKLDRYVRNHTVNRFGPVREVEYGKTKGLVLEVAFEGLQRSTRHKSGVAMRFPRIHRIRWDKPPAEADRLKRSERSSKRGEQELYPLEASEDDGAGGRNARSGRGDPAGHGPPHRRDPGPGLHRDHGAGAPLGGGRRPFPRPPHRLLPPHLGLAHDPGERRSGRPGRPPGRARPPRAAKRALRA
jgi:DNA ligase-1